MSMVFIQFQIKSSIRYLIKKGQVIQVLFLFEFTIVLSSGLLSSWEGQDLKVSPVEREKKEWETQET